MTDNITGEQVSYTYDQLNRLVQAASTVTGHTMTFAYDGFGNLTQQGQTSLSIDQSTNRINSAGYQYNANGNVTQTPGPATYSYDVANRLVSNGAIYNPRNQLVFDGTYIYLYTPDGKLAGKYAPAWGAYTSSNAFIQGGVPDVYFGGKLIQEAGQWVMTDRLGSVRLNGNGARSSYQRYGAEVAPTSDQRTKFATYYRDSAGLDYAGQRYYSNVTGRFLTADPLGMQAADPKNPTSWNQYAYVNGDPVNFNDPTGRLLAAPGIDCGSNWMWDASLSGPCAGGNYGDDDWGGGGGGGGFYCGGSYFDPGPNPACYAPVPPTLPPPPAQPDCNAVLVADIANYLGAYRNATSPLYTWDNMDALVNAGMNYDVDPRFIVALSVAETQAGTNLNPKWGPYNAWNVSSGKPPNSYTSWGQAITAVTMLADSYLANGFTNTTSFYKYYEHTSNYRTGLRNLNSALAQMDGSKNDLTDPCSPLNPRPPNQ